MLPDSRLVTHVRDDRGERFQMLWYSMPYSPLPRKKNMDHTLLLHLAVCVSQSRVLFFSISSEFILEGGKGSSKKRGTFSLSALPSDQRLDMRMEKNPSLHTHTVQHTNVEQSIICSYVHDLTNPCSFSRLVISSELLRSAPFFAC